MGDVVFTAEWVLHTLKGPLASPASQTGELPAGNGAGPRRMVGTKKGAAPNLYFGLKDKGWSCYYWLNIFVLCRNLLTPPQ
jgi:hypothetical protein